MTEDEFILLSRAWDRAMVGNHADVIGEFMADDWVIIGPDGLMTGKDAFLRQVRSGDLMHDEMTSEGFEVRRYGETAIVMSRGVSGGKYRGRSFRLHEHAVSVFVRSDGRWRCVLTHLSTVTP